MHSRDKYIILVLIILFVVSCGPSKKLKTLQSGSLKAQLSLAKESEVPELEYRQSKKDTLVIKEDDGTETLIMKAIKDDETGEMVASDVIDAAVVTARFRNVAERNGKVDLMFQVIVPEKMMDSEWQLRFYPDMYIMADSIRLDPVIITGAGYRKAQLRGYQQYERFLKSIVTDDRKFINMWQLEQFVQRNLPEVYAFKSDTSYVSDQYFFSFFGVTEEDAIEHYTNKILKFFNERRKAKKGKMYKKFVKSPIVTDGIRLDTVLRAINGDFIYNYVQTINTRPKLRKVDIVLSGSIYKEDKRIYKIPRSEPLTFYISSISAFADGTEKYLTKVIERRAEANTACYIEFASGSSDVDERLGHNRREISRIKGNLLSLMQNQEFDLDSIVVTSGASPEGALNYNDKLSKKRSDGISKYFSTWMRRQRDSLDRERGFQVDEDGNIIRPNKRSAMIPLLGRSGGENWELLDRLVKNDTILTEGDKADYFALAEMKDLDIRESRMQAKPYYKRLRETFYPRLRVVKFDFHLHRKGMIKDTVHTTVLDTVYMEGVRALKDMDYETALLKLGKYNDYNTAIALVALDRNLSALAILEKELRISTVNYMLAVVYSRLGREQEAVSCYLQACKQNPQYVHRGNLDPEISSLIKLYGLNKQEEDDLYSY